MSSIISRAAVLMVFIGVPLLLYSEPAPDPILVSVPTVAKRTKISNKNLKLLTFKFSFKQTYADPVMKNLDMPGSYGKYGVDNRCGKIVRVCRFDSITRAVEIRYNLPPRLLAAMIMEESTGMDLFPNAKDDGGVGLIHQQPCIARDFSLKTFKNCDELVCKKHGRSLRDSLEAYNYDRKKVIKFDDRLHPIKNIDATGRMVAYYIQLEPMKGLGPLRSAIKRYAGKYNYKQYWEDVITNMAYLSDPNTMKQVEAYFNEINPDFTINGKQANFKEYLRVSNQQAVNYGLNEYRALGKYEILNSDGGTSVYKTYVTPKKKNLKKVCD